MITKHFIEYFTHNFNIKSVPPELDFNLKLYSSMFLSFIQYIQTPDIKLLSFWNKRLKPFIKTNYPCIKNGIFTTNVDFDFIIKEIDTVNKNNNPEQLLMNEIKMKLNERNKKNENNNVINMKKNANIRVVKVNGGYKVKVSVILKKGLLRHRLEKDGIIKSLGSPFK